MGVTGEFEQKYRRKENERESDHVHYRVNDIPHFAAILLFGFQQTMISISGILVVPFLISELACAGSYTAELRVKLIAATFTTAGVATLLQTTFGLRLCILHGPSYAFIPSLLVYKSLPENKCEFNELYDVSDEFWLRRLQTIEGALLLSSMVFIILGLTGLVGKLAKGVGPLTICPMMVLLTLSTVPEIKQKLALHWISIVELVVLIAVAIFLEDLNVPMPTFSLRWRRCTFVRMRLFGLFPYLIGIGSVWLVCFLLTVTNIEPVGGEARTDKNTTMAVLRDSPWFQIPYPACSIMSADGFPWIPFSGQFGSPRFDWGLIVGYCAAIIASVIESVGNYGVCARISQQRRPPSHAVNRAIVVEGLSCVLAALLGSGCGITTYSENTAVMQVTKVVSRITMQMAGVMLILLGVFTKAAALLASIPEAIIGAVFATGMSLIAGIALSTLQAVDLRLSRNLSILGVSTLLGMVIPSYFEEHQIQTGSNQLDELLNVVLRVPMLIGGVLGFILDNTVPGATRNQRGFFDDSDVRIGERPLPDDGYHFPDCINRILRFLWPLQSLPIVPSQKSLKRAEDAARARLPS